MMPSMSSLERVLGRASRKTYNWLYRVLMLEVGGFVARRCSPNTAHHVATSSDGSYGSCPGIVVCGNAFAGHSPTVRSIPRRPLADRSPVRSATTS